MPGPQSFFMGLDVTPLAKNDAIPETLEGFKNMKPGDKKILEEAASIACTMFINTPEYKSGDTRDPFYKPCCEWMNHCSFTNAFWFYPAITAAGFLLLNLITIVFICLICRKKGGRMSGGLDDKMEDVGEEKEEDVE